MFTNSSCATHYKEDCSLCIKTKEKRPPWQRERLFLSKAEDFMLPRDNSFIFCRVSFGSGVVVAVCGMHRSVLAQQRSHFTSAAKKTKILDSLAHWHVQINRAGHTKKNRCDLGQQRKQNTPLLLRIHTWWQRNVQIMFIPSITHLIFDHGSVYFLA